MHDRSKGINLSRTSIVEFKLRVANKGTEREGWLLYSDEIKDFSVFIADSSLDQIVDLIGDFLPAYCQHKGLVFRRSLLNTSEVKEPLVGEQMIQCLFEVS